MVQRGLSILVVSTAPERRTVGRKFIDFIGGRDFLMSSPADQQRALATLPNGTPYWGSTSLNSVSGEIPVGFDFVTEGKIGKNHLGAGEVSLGSSSITGGDFVFPKMKNVFTVTVPAAFDSTLFGQVIESSQTFGLRIRPGVLHLTFDLVSACGGGSSCYLFDRATFTSTPEPSTVLLSLTGLFFVAGRAWQKRKAL